MGPLSSTMYFFFISLLITIASSEDSSSDVGSSTIQPTTTKTEELTTTEELPAWEPLSCWKKVNLEEYPYLASIYSKCNGSSHQNLISTGVILSNNSVLGLLWNPNASCNYTVQVGENPWGYQGSDHEAQLVLHENHTLRVGRTNYSNALVIYKLNNTIVYGPRAQPIEISESKDILESVGDHIKILNALVYDNVVWGMLLNNAILNTNVTVLNEERCRMLMKNWSGPMAQNYSHPPLEGTFCTVHERKPDPCEEKDSFVSSVMIADGKLVGFLSDYINGTAAFRLNETSQDGEASIIESTPLFGNSSVVSVYLNVAHFKDWITSGGPYMYYLNELGSSSTDEEKNGFWYKISSFSPLKELRKFFSSL